jgi:hypothetical protein
MYDTIIDMLEDIALSKYPIKEEFDETTKVKKTIWVENEYEFSLIFDPNSEKYLFLETKQLEVESPPALFEFKIEQKNGRGRVITKEITEAQGKELFNDLTIVIRKEGYLGLYGNGSNWNRIIVDEEISEDN